MYVWLRELRIWYFESYCSRRGDSCSTLLRIIERHSIAMLINIRMFLSSVMHFLISCVYCWYYEGYINYVLFNYHVNETARRPPVESDVRKRFESSKCLHHSSTDWYSMWRHNHCMNVNKYPELFDLKVLHLRSTITSTLRLDTTSESSALCSQENAKYPGNWTFRSLWYRWRLCEAKSWLLTNIKIWSVGKQVVRVGHAKFWSVSHGSIGGGLQ